jgi:hypothetical protein
MYYRATMVFVNEEIEKEKYVVGRSTQETGANSVVAEVARKPGDFRYP